MRPIDADTLREVFENAGWWDNADRDVAQDLLDKAPTVDAEPVRHGRWKIDTVWTFNSFEPEIVEEKCSLCGRYVQRYRTQSPNNCCPNCGAKMDEGGQNASN